MRSPLLLVLLSLAAACTTVTPREQAELVAAMPGKKALRIGVVVLGTARTLPEAFGELPAAPGGAAPLPVIGALYAEQTLLPESLPADQVVEALQQLGAFTDVVQLPFDSRGIASREAMIQRVQDRVWPTAIAQQLDAVLVIEGVQDAGLRWSDSDEGLFTLDTVLWWLAWPFGLWIQDRDYTADCGLVAAMFWTGDASSNPQPVVVSATAATKSLAPWDRASAPLLGLVLPPVWVADDPASVAASVTDYTREMLPISLVQQIKLATLTGPVDLDLQLLVKGDQYQLQVHSDQEVTTATIVSLPRGALTPDAMLQPRNLRLASEIELTAEGPRHLSSGNIARATVDSAALALVRVSVSLVSGEQVSRTWTVAELLQ